MLSQISQSGDKYLRAESPICFVIMPFSKTKDKHDKQYWDNHFESFLKPTIEELGLIAKRSEPLRGDILKEIISNLVISPIVVADITDLNPNVFWELGVRQSFKHGTITIAEAGSEIPFDIGIKSTLFYHPNDYIKNEKFRKKFIRAIKDCLSHPDRPDSHVLETISGRGTLFSIILYAETTRRFEAIYDEYENNLDLFSRILEQAEKNKKNRENAGWPTDRFMTACIELALTNRYLDEEKPFYKTLSRQFNSLCAMNSMLDCWRLSNVGTENWFIDNRKFYEKRFETFKKTLDKAQERHTKKAISAIC